MIDPVPQEYYEEIFQHAEQLVVNPTDYDTLWNSKVLKNFKRVVQ